MFSQTSTSQTAPPPSPSPDVQERSVLQSKQIKQGHLLLPFSFTFEQSLLGNQSTFALKRVLQQSRSRGNKRNVLYRKFKTDVFVPGDELIAVTDQSVALELKQMTKTFLLLDRLKPRLPVKEPDFTRGAL